MNFIIRISSDADLDNRLSAMYSYARQSSGGQAERTKSLSSAQNGKDHFTSHKCRCSTSATRVFSDGDQSGSTLIICLN